MRYLLDTSAVLIHYQGAPGGQHLVDLFKSEQNEFFLSVVSLVEFGRKLKELAVPLPEARQTLAAYRHLFSQILPVDEPTASLALDLAYKTRPRLPMVDSLIAAAALQAKACLIHADAHLSAIPKSALTQLNLRAT